jgi:hypothetical protein
MPRGGTALQGDNDPPVDPDTSPDSWGFHINITPTQELYSASGVSTGPHLPPSAMDGKQNHVFQTLQNSNKTKVGWTNVPI